jgi:hypothetical protein
VVSDPQGLASKVFREIGDAVMARLQQPTR